MDAQKPVGRGLMQGVRIKNTDTGEEVEITPTEEEFERLTQTDRPVWCFVQYSAVEGLAVSFMVDGEDQDSK